jgi:hypothetical protein
VRGWLARWGTRGALTAVVLLAALHVGLLVYVFAARAGYPLDLEWMEGGTLTHALRILDGKPIYAPPSVEFISFLYTPLYPALLALLARVAGLSYLLGRMVSIAAFALAVGVAWRAVRREGGGAAWPAAAAGLIAAAFGPTEGWYDLVRVDSLALWLTLAGLYVLRHHHERPAGVALAAAILAAGVFCKQTVLLYLGIGGVALLALNWRLTWLYALVGGGFVAAGALWLQHTTGGWFRVYVFDIHQRHDFYWHRLLWETEWRMLRSAPILVGLPVVLWLWAMVRRGAGTGARYWGFVATASILASSLSWATQWANFNAAIPGYVLLALALAVFGATLRRPLVAVALALLVGVQLVWLRPEPRYRPWTRAGWSVARYLPDVGTRAAAQRFLGRLRRIQGPILVPYHPFYPVLVGRPAHFHQMGINDVTRAGMPVPADLRAAIRDGVFSAIVLDRPPDPRYAGGLVGYRLEKIPGKASPHTLVGFRVRPSLLYLREAVPTSPSPERPRRAPPTGRAAVVPAAPAPSPPRPPASESPSRSSGPRRSPAR